MITLDIEIYEPDERAQKRYLVHGFDDVYWTDDLEDALGYLKQDLQRLAQPKHE